MRHPDDALSAPALPANLIPAGSSPTFDRATLPAALCAEHALAAGRWGVLNVLDGRLAFVDLASGDETELVAPAEAVIAPRRPHKLRVDGPLRCRIDFFREGAPGATTQPPPSAAHPPTADPTRPDLGDRDKIAAFVAAFYARVADDDLLGPVFVRQAAVDWDEHRAKLTAFWCKLELGLPGFHGAPTHKHSMLSREVPFTAAQFERWIFLFHDTIDRGWQGPHAESMKTMAVRIAQAQSRLVEGAEPWTAGASTAVVSRP